MKMQKIFPINFTFDREVFSYRKLPFSWRIVLCSSMKYKIILKAQLNSNTNSSSNTEYQSISIQKVWTKDRVAAVTTQNKLHGLKYHFHPL